MRQAVYSRTKKQMAIKLSVLIPTLYSRRESLSKLIEDLQYQAQDMPVQILWLGDNRSTSIGEKRNQLLNLAQGEWISFIDDDDHIASNYIKTIIEAIKQNPEKAVITFQGRHTKDGIDDVPFQYSLAYGRNIKTTINGERWQVMLPDHLCVWKKNRIIQSFPHKGLGEDHEWARKQAQTITVRDVVYLSESLYHYDYSTERSECRR